MNKNDERSADNSELPIPDSIELTGTIQKLVAKLSQWKEESTGKQ